MEEEFNRLDNKIWKTMGSRFISSKRFETLDKLSNITTNLAAVYILCINLLILIPQKNRNISDVNITFFTICASIFILALSLFLQTRKYNELSHNFHLCARELNALYDKLMFLKNRKDYDESKLLTINDEYNKILINYNLNHSKLDFDMFKLQHKNVFRYKYYNFELIKVYIINFITYYFLYSLAILSGILIIFFSFK